MRFKDDAVFRTKISALAKQGEALHLTCDKLESGRFLVGDNKRSYHVALAYCGDEIDATCECETYKNANLCIHIAYALKKCYNFETNRFDIPELGKMLEAIVEAKPIESEKEKVMEEKAEEKEAKGKEVEARVQKLIEKEDEEVVKLVDELDVRQIIVSLAGEYEDLPMIYEFTDGSGQTRTIVSWNGYIKAARLQGNIKLEFLGFEEHAGKLIAKAKAVDLKRNIEVTAIASRLPKKSEFTHEILASKAMRNALKKILDPDILAKVIEHARKMKSVKELSLRESSVP